MTINLVLRRHALILGLAAAAALSVAPAFAQSQTQQNSNTGCYSGPSFDVEKNAPCAPGTPSNAPVSQQAQKPDANSNGTPEEKYGGCSPGQASNAPVNQAAQGPNASCYSTPDFDIEKQNAR